ncbi:MAG TPA: hypothetical protein VF637_18770, partial [Sphingomicrobium sp.]
LSSVLTNSENLDFTASGVDANLSIDAGFLQSIAGAGNASHLTLRMDAADTFTIDPTATVTQNGSDYIFYSDSSMNTEVARMTLTN